MSSIIITMAGESSRFKAAGIAVPKYRLIVNGKSLFSWSVSSLSQFIEAGWNLIFVGRSSDSELEAFIREELLEFGAPHFDLVQLDLPTDGQATTAMHASQYVKLGEAVCIYNIDTYVDPEFLNPTDMHGDGWIPCFPGEGNGWSFVEVKSGDNAVSVQEKVRVSEHATVGLYGFCRFALLSDAYERNRELTGESSKAERYVAPLYNSLIEAGYSVRKHDVPLGAVIPLGTPSEVEAFAERGITVR